VLPESPWRGYRPPLEPPAPAAGTFWGDPAPLLSAAAQAALEGDLAGKVQARWPATPATAGQPPWRGSGRRSWHETPDFPGVHEMRRNIPQT
jgi:hypothetical protein